jgi:hypothetical protein
MPKGDSQASASARRVPTEEDLTMKAMILLGAALLAFWLMGSTWQQDSGGPTTQGGCVIDPDGRPNCQQ